LYICTSNKAKQKSHIMTTLLTKTELIEKLQNSNGNLVVTEDQIGFNPKNASLYYYFTEENGIMVTDYIYSQSTGLRTDSFTRFWNFVNKNL
jgi:hypothetical protein